MKHFPDLFLRILIVITIFLSVAISSQSQDVFEAVKSNDLTKVKALVIADPQVVNARDNTGRTPLHYAAMSGNAEVIKILLKRGAMPSASNKSGYTPLVYAANGGFKEAVNLLLDNGADYDRTGDKALEVLMLSMGNGLERLAQVVIEKDGTDLLNDELRNREIMHEAVKSGSVEIVELLIANDVRLEKGVDKYGWTPIHYAVKEGRLVMVEFLAENGVNINTRAFSGESAYNMAESAGNKELQDIIIKQGGNKEPKKLPKNRSPYLGQKVPGNTPELFAPGIVSTAAHEFSSCFSPDGKEFYFTRRQPELNYAAVMYSKLADGAWTEPEMVPFVEGQFSFEPFVTPDNKRLFFQMGKAVNGGLHMYTMYVDRPRKDGEKSKIREMFLIPTRPCMSQPR